MQEKQIDVLDQFEPLILEIDKKFWHIDKDKNGNFIGFKIDKLKFVDYMYNMGFRRFDVDKNHIFIKIYDHRICKEVNETIIVDEIIDSLREEYKENPIAQLNRAIYVDDLISHIYTRIGSLFDTKLLYRLKSKKPIEFNTDTRDLKFLYYLNGFIEISKIGHELKSYSQLKGYIWESEILQRNFSQADFKLSVSEQFLNKICNNDINRLNTLKTIIGYLTHSFTDTKLKMVFLTDSRISEDDEPNGRTGKTLFCKLIAHVLCNNPNSNLARTYCEINGKDFDPKNKNKYEAASLETKLIVINDLKRNFYVEDLFNDITEGLTVNIKFQLPFRIRPKMIATGNKTAKIEGDSAKDRFVEFEFGEYFHKNHSPEQEFKHWFFRDWDKQEWLRYDTYMINCIRYYLANGLIEPPQINLHARKLRENTNKDFIEWIESSPIQIQLKESALTNTGINKNEFFESFTTNYRDFNKLTQNKFSRWIKYWCKYGTNGYLVEDAITEKGREYLFTKQ